MSRLYFLSFILSVFALGSAISSHGQCSFTGLNSSYCIDAGVVPLSGGTVYYGPGVTGSNFDPAVAGIGTHQLVTTSGLATSYSLVTSGTFSPVAGSGTPLALTNDSESGLINIG